MKVIHKIILIRLFNIILHHNKKSGTTCKNIFQKTIRCLATVKGVTLIELMIALGMTATLTTTVFYFWNHINRHTIVYINKAQFSTETNRIITSIVSQVRSAKQIISYDYNMIHFVSKNNDTLQYRYDGDSLYRNERGLTITSKNARISQFEIKDLNEGNSTEARYAYLEFTLTMISGKNDTSTYSLSINVPKPTEGSQYW
jgi:hypothetical protein